MSTTEPTPLPDAADLARVNDALDAMDAGRSARVPGTLAADQHWLDAFVATRDALRGPVNGAGLDGGGLDAQRERAVAAALAVFDAEFVSPATEPDAAAQAVAHAAVAPRPSPVPTAPVPPTDRTADHDGDHAGLVLRPLRWRRAGLVASAAAAVLVVGVALSTGLGGGADTDSSGAGVDGGGLATPAGEVLDASAETKTVQIDNAPTGPTIGAIEGPAVAAPSLDRPEQLLDLARRYIDLERASAGSAAPAAPDDSAVAGEEPPAYGCELSPEQAPIGEVVWNGTMAVAVYDAVSGTVTVLDPTCAVLTTVSP